MSDWSHLKPYGYAPGGYMGRCSSCRELQYDIDKRANSCRPCAQARHDADHPFTERRERHQPSSLSPWMWRRVHTLTDMRRLHWGFFRPEHQYIDAGYCLDRYSIESPHGDVRMSRP